jgi:uncharacterized protein
MPQHLFRQPRPSHIRRPLPPGPISKRIFAGAFMNNRKGIVAYLLIAFGLAWINWEMVIRHGISVQTPRFMLYSLPSAFAPALAAFVVRKWITREGFADAGLRLNFRKWPYYVVAWLLPVLVVGCIVVLATLFGVGKADFSLARGYQYLSSIGTPARMHLPFGTLLGVLLLEAIFVTPISFGEEFGWRSYLQLRLWADRPVFSAVATGVIWGIWHYPVLLRGYDFPDNRVAGPIVFTVTAVLLSIIFGWLRVRTGSVWSCSLAHAATNAIGASLTVLLFGGGASLLFVLDIGVLAWIPLGALSAWIVFTGQLKPAARQLSENALAQAVQGGV